jgi:hypothetical protein
MHVRTGELYRVRQKHLTVFEMWKPAWPLRGASILTVTMYSDVWSLVEMERWSVQKRIAAVELFIKTESVTATQRGFRQQFQRRDAPSRNSLLLWVSKWRLEGSVKDSKPQGRPRSARTPDNVEQVRDALLRWSARQHALALRLRTAAFAEFPTTTCIITHTKSKLLRNLVDGTRWADFSFVLNSWIWWIIIAT